MSELKSLQDAFIEALLTDKNLLAKPSELISKIEPLILKDTSNMRSFQTLQRALNLNIGENILAAMEDEARLEEELKNARRRLQETGMTDNRIEDVLSLIKNVVLTIKEKNQKETITVPINVPSPDNEPKEDSWYCQKCGEKNTGNFCKNCGSTREGVQSQIRPDVSMSPTPNFNSLNKEQNDTYHHNTKIKLSQYRTMAIACVCLTFVVVVFAMFINKSDKEIPHTETVSSDNVIVQKETKENNNAKSAYLNQSSNMSTSTNNVVATYYVVNCRESITLRSSPSTSASEITQIPLGQAVGFIETAENGFSKINYDGLIGYGLSNYLSSDKPNMEKQERIPAQVVNCKEWITLRSTPSTSASSLAHIPLGAYVTCLGDAGNEFYEVEYNGEHGYALKAYLEYR